MDAPPIERSGHQNGGDATVRRRRRKASERTRSENGDHPLDSPRLREGPNVPIPVEQAAFEAAAGAPLDAATLKAIVTAVKEELKNEQREPVRQDPGPEPVTAPDEVRNRIVESRQPTPAATEAPQEDFVAEASVILGEEATLASEEVAWEALARPRLHHLRDHSTTGMPTIPIPHAPPLVPPHAPQR